jgi:hypothetical protein
MLPSCFTKKSLQFIREKKKGIVYQYVAKTKIVPWLLSRYFFVSEKRMKNESANRRKLDRGLLFISWFEKTR